MSKGRVQSEAAVEPLERTQLHHDVQAFLDNIACGDVALSATGGRSSWYDGIMVYDADNGWQIAIFWDASDWDYVEWVKTDDGRVLLWGDMSDELQNYRPDPAVVSEAYGGSARGS